MIFSDDEIEKITEILRTKELLKGFSLNSRPYEEKDCIILVYDKLPLRLPVIISKNETITSNNVDSYTKKYGNLSISDIGHIQYSGSSISDISLEEFSIKPTPEYKKERTLFKYLK